jgi:hypothetical protein
VAGYARVANLATRMAQLLGWSGAEIDTAMLFLEQDLAGLDGSGQ